MYKFITSFHYSKVLRLVFVWSIFIGFSGTIFSTSLVSTPQGIALVPNQVHAADVCETSVLNPGSAIECLMKVILFAPAQLFSLGIGFAVSLIQYATNPNVFNKLFDLPAVYTAWGVVRDIFNVIFIFVLLFSAFATIFRVQKYHLKNILLMVILMALLVNFSWPLAGLIIDFSNVLMLFFLGGQSGISLSSGIGQGSSFASTLLAEGANGEKSIQGNSATSLIMISIFVFIFMVTMLAVAFQLFIRTIALLVLLIFSPIGIAGAAIPKMQGLSKMWWESFTRYVFTGPIAVFMLIFAAALMQDFTASTIGNDLRASSGSTAAAYGTELLTNIQKFIIPMVILWVGVIASSKLSDVGSKFVTNRARALGAAGGKRFAKTYARGVGNIATFNNGARVEGAVAGKFRGVGKQFDNLQTRAQDKRQGFSDKSQATYLNNQGFRVGGDPNALSNLDSRNLAKYKKKMKEDELSVSSKLDIANDKNGDPIKRQAARELLSDSKEVITVAEDYVGVVNAMGNDLDNTIKAIENTPKNGAVKKVTVDQYTELVDKINATTDFRDSGGDLIPDQNEARTDALKALSKRFVKAGKADTVFQHKAKRVPINQAFAETYGSMPAPTFAEQGDTMKLAASDPALKGLIQTELLAGDPTYKNEVIKRADPDKRKHII